MFSSVSFKTLGANVNGGDLLDEDELGCVCVCGLLYLTQGLLYI
jgi:hypothetical protein